MQKPPTWLQKVEYLLNKSTYLNKILNLSSGKRQWLPKNFRKDLTIRCSIVNEFFREKNVSATNFLANFSKFQHKRPLYASHKYKFGGNDIIYSNSHMYTKKIIQKNGEKSFYQLRIIFFRHCPSISTSTDTES